VLFFNCEPNTDKILTTLTDPQADHGKNVWSDDSVEMFFCTNPGTAPHDYYQVIVNSAGVAWDGKNRRAIGSPA